MNLLPPAVQPGGAPAAAGPGPRVTLLLLAVALGLALLPLALVRLPPLTDYPFHLARLAILISLPDNRIWAELYQLNTFLIPNVGMDLALLGLSRLMPLELAGRVFVGLTMVLMVGGTVALHRAVWRSWSAWPLVAALFLHNWIFLYGFLNYLLGVGVLLWALAAWIALLERPPLLRVAVGAGFGLLLFFCHMVALGLFAVTVGGIALERGWRAWRRDPPKLVAELATAALPFVIPALLFFLASPTGGEAVQPLRWQPQWWWKPFVVAQTFLSADLTVDLISFAVLGLLAVLVLWKGRIRVGRHTGAALGLLVLTFLVMPYALFSALHVDTRLPMAILFVALGVLRVSFENPAWSRLAVGALGALMVTRSAMIAKDWVAFDRVYDAVRAAEAGLPEGSMLFSVTAFPWATDLDGWLQRWRPPMVHAAALAVLEKPVFVPSVWAHPSQQPIVVREPWRHIYAYQNQTPIRVDTGEQLARVEARIRELTGALPERRPAYVMLLFPSRLKGTRPPGLRALVEHARFTLFAVDPAPQLAER